MELPDNSLRRYVVPASGEAFQTENARILPKDKS
jgi:hypothetical protein